MANTEFKLKITVNKATNKVVFAEASKEGVDFLFSLLEMPLASVIKLVSKEMNAAGSIDNVYKSVEAIDTNFLQSTYTKASLLSPVVRSSASYSNFFVPPPEKRMYYTCGNSHNSGCIFFGDVKNMKCKTCLLPLRYESVILETERPNGFVKSELTYTIMDDLTVAPVVGFSNYKFLLEFNVSDLEERVVKVGYEQSFMLLKASLQSKTVLSDVFLQACPKSEAG